MPENQVTDPITDQEIAFARLVLSETMTDRCAAGAAGLNPDTAAYTKAKLVSYMQDQQAPLQQQSVPQDTNLSRLSRPAAERAVDEPRRFTVTRDQVLTRLWEIAAIGPEITRGSLAGQVKAISMIVAIEGLIPDRRAASTHKPPPETVDIYEAEWLRNQRAGKNVDPQPIPASAQEETTSQSSSAPDSPPSTAEPIPAPASAVSQHQVAPGNGTSTPSLAPRVPMADHFAPDTRVPFSIKKNPFARRR